MGSAVKRSRAERAEATRVRILEAAREEFVTQGYPAAMMASIAERAGVSVQMVYFAFGKKPRLFLAVMERAVVGDEGLAPPQTAAWRAATEQPTAQGVVAAFITGLAEVFRRAAPLSVQARVAAALEEEVAAAGAGEDDLRAEGYREIVRAAATKGALRPGLDEDRATDLLLSLYSPALYVEFTQGRGWSHEQLVGWLAASVPDLLFEPPAP